VSYCPECEAIIDEEFEDIGEMISCPECGVELEVISIDPVEFDLAPIDDDEDDEEWDDEETYDEDDDGDEKEDL
jgi:alpha-aminoadipate carrier protein LysW